LGKHEDALAAYDEVIKLEPQNPIAYNNKGFVLKTLKRTEEAI